MIIRVDGSAIENVEWYDASGIDLFRTCPQRYFNAYERKIGTSGPKDAALSFGGSIHKALACIYGDPEWKSRVKTEKYGETYKFLAVFLEDYKDPEDEKDHRTQHYGIELLSGYVMKWRPDKGEPFEVLEVEYPFMFDVDDFAMVGRMDLVVRDRATQLVMPDDHKTAGRFGDQFTLNFRQSMQVGTYIEACSRLYGPCNQMKINALRTSPKITPDESFLRTTTTRTQAEKDRWYAEVRSTVRQIREARVSGVWERHGGSCFAYNRMCDFWPICNAGAPHSEESIISANYERRVWDPINHA